MSITLADYTMPEHLLRQATNRAQKTSLEIAAETIIHAVGDTTDRPGLDRTPERFAKAMHEILGGYKQTPSSVVGQGIFPSTGNGLVVVRDVEFFSMCEHHMLPFWGKATVAYLPENKILGLSKIPRLLDVYAKRLQVQERITEQVADAIMELIQPRGVAVSISGQHMCMMMRGVSKQQSNTLTTTQRFTGNLSEYEKQRLIEIVSTT